MGGEEQTDRGGGNADAWQVAGGGYHLLHGQESSLAETGRLSAGGAEE